MKGLELSEKFYNEYKEKMLFEFEEIRPFLAFGLCGSGSECLGYDDSLSQDHDFEPGFCIFIPDESLIDSRTAFRLERAYAKLPKEFEGFKRLPQSPVGGNRHGVIRTDEFFEARLGTSNGELTPLQWLTLPSQALLEASSGRIFCDNYGEVTDIREKIKCYPRDIKLKKLAGHLLLMGQSGQYNYKRCLERGDTAAARLALFEFVKSGINAVFLLNDSYTPYYKWQFYALKKQGKLSELAQSFEYLISTPDNNAEKVIEDIIFRIAEQLRNDGLTDYCGNESEGHAHSVNNHICSGEIRNLNILSGV